MDGSNGNTSSNCVLGGNPFKTPPTRPAAAASSAGDGLVLNRTSSTPTGHPSPERRRKVVKRPRYDEDQDGGSIDYPEYSAGESESDHDEESKDSCHPRRPRKRRNCRQSANVRARRERAFSAIELSRQLQLQTDMYKFISDARRAFNEQIVMNYGVVRDVQMFVDSEFQPPEGITPARLSKSQDLVAHFEESSRSLTNCAVKGCFGGLSNHNYVVAKLVQNDEFRFYKAVCCPSCIKCRIDPSAQLPDSEGNIVTARDTPLSGGVSAEARYKAGIVIFPTSILR